MRSSKVLNNEIRTKYIPLFIQKMIIIISLIQVHILYIILFRYKNRYICLYMVRN